MSVSITPRPKLIISADSVQIYEKLTVGANKPSEEEMRDWGVEHMLLGTFPLKCDDGASTAASWFASTVNILNDQASTADGDGGATVVCGGSSMYLDWLLHGVPSAPGWKGDEIDSSSEKIWDDVIRACMEGERGADDEGEKTEGKEEIFSQTSSTVAAADGNPTSTTPEAWAEYCERLYSRLIHATDVKFLPQPLLDELRGKMISTTPNDVYRLRRSIEIAVTRLSFDKGSLEPLFNAKRRGREQLANFDFRPFFLCPKSRMDHYHLIDRRCEKMVRSGLLEEVATLIRDHGIMDTLGE